MELVTIERVTEEELGQLWIERLPILRKINRRRGKGRLQEARHQIILFRERFARAEAPECMLMGDMDRLRPGRVVARW